INSAYPDVEKSLTALGFKEKNGRYSLGKGDVCFYFRAEDFPPGKLLFDLLSLLKSKKIGARSCVSTRPGDCAFKSEVVVFVGYGLSAGVVRGVMPGRTEYSFSCKHGKKSDKYAENVLSRVEIGGARAENGRIIHSFYDCAESEAFCQALARASIVEDASEDCFNMIRVDSLALPLFSDDLIVDMLISAGAKEITDSCGFSPNTDVQASRAAAVYVSDVNDATILVKFTEAING
ncbi:MAG: hypothetical protein ACI4SC_01865, partial [Candidatus Neoclostridium sp.]